MATYEKILSAVIGDKDTRLDGKGFSYILDQYFELALLSAIEKAQSNGLNPDDKVFGKIRINIECQLHNEDGNL